MGALIVSIVYAGDTRRCLRHLAWCWRVAAVAVAVMSSDPAPAQVTCCNNLVVLPSVANTNANTDVSAAFAQFDLGSHFLKFLGDQGGANWQGIPNEGGGGASAAAPTYRAWLEGYGLRTHTGAQTDFTGDTRRSFGGVAGVGMTVAPGAMIGLFRGPEPYQHRRDRPAANRKLDLTQIGLNGVYETGPWTFSAPGFMASPTSIRTAIRRPAWRPPRTMPACSGRSPKRATTTALVAAASSPS